MGWHTSDDVDEFLARADDFLRSRPVENTMLLTLTHVLQRHGRHTFGPDDPIFGWFTSDDGTVDGACLQTPPHPLLLTAMPADAVPALAEALARRPLPGVNGRGTDADAFAAAWQRLTGHSARPVMRTRLYRLGTLTPPAPPPGKARIAGPADRDLLIDWFDAFQREVHAGVRESNAAIVDDKMSFGGLMLWEVDGAAVATAGVTQREAGMVRVAPVYTPPELRGRGYGGAVTAAITRAALDAGAGDVVLFTDLMNPTSNALYERLGYRPVEDRTVMEFQR
jgi:predicted GNAT family acetyltransferase